MLLVLFRHSGIAFAVAKAGWIGVDLFFVLSGFLISGLLFSEYKRCGSISFKRFFMRRGFKIYPAFYLLLLATLLVEDSPFAHTLHSATQYLSEILYFQNYGSPAIWGHTWSLGVEEHFYILLPVFLLLLIRFSNDRKNPFRSIPIAFLVIGILCLTARIIMAIRTSNMQEWQILRSVLLPTHERIDSLFFGVLLGYLHHFRPQLFDQLLLSKRNIVALAVLSAALLLPALVLPQPNKFMMTAGITMLYLGFGAVLVLCLYTRNILPPSYTKLVAIIGSGFAFVGMYSYSIYLWHGAILPWGQALVRRGLHTEVTPATVSVLYFLASLTVGISMSRMIEFPMLRVRDRFFPAMSSTAPEERRVVPSSLAVAEKT